MRKAELRALRPPDAAPFQLVFPHLVPDVETLKRDLARAEIPFVDEPGRRADSHALRVTFGTNLVLSGAHPRVVQELMRHSDIRLTMKICADASKLPLAEGVAALPSFGCRSPDLLKNSTLKIINGRNISSCGVTP
jgi:hypothetical protein